MIKKKSQSQWLTPVIAVTQRGDLGSKPSGQKAHKTSSQPISQEWWCTPVISAVQDRRTEVQTDQGINSSPYSKSNSSRKGWGHGSSGRGLSSKCKAQYSQKSLS
jgi:hypothetical protein